MAEPGQGAAGGLRYAKLTSALATALVALLAVAIVMQTAGYLHFPGVLPHRTFIDFDAFHLVGRMGLRGDIGEAYVPDRLFAAEDAAGAAGHHMPWAYPLQFDLIVVVLALLPVGVAYFLLSAGGLAAYLAVLRALSGARFAETVIATAPGLILTVYGGQNGLLTGTLAGLFAMAALRGRAVAGVPLGLMVIKPHLALGLGVLVLAQARWRVLAVAVLTAVFSGGVATLAFGPDIWMDFMRGLQATGTLLQGGVFQSFRLISVYGALRAPGVGAGASLAAQGVVALAAVVLIAAIARSRLGPRSALGIAALCTLAISPYAYDYDLPIFGIAVALLLPDLLARLRGVGAVALLLLTWAATGWSVWLILRFQTGERADQMVGAGRAMAAAGPIYVVLILVVVLILWRQPQRTG